MDRQRLADALAYDQARRRRLANVVPMPADGQPEVAPTPSLRSNVENLSIGLGEGLTNQLEGVRALITDPIGTAKGAYEAVRGVVRDPSVIAQALREMGSKAVSGPLGAGEVVGEMLGPMRGRPAPDMLELDVYHGTPHRFPATEANPLGEFDASKIGTGEGAQAYGHGIYLAESPNVARGYREALSGGDRGRFVEKQGKRISEVGEAEGFENLTPQDLAARIAAQYGGDISKAVTETKSILQSTPKGYARDVRAKALRELQKNKEQYEGATWVEPGAFYTADLPDEMVDRMLDWDKPLSEQRELATPILKELGYLRPNDNGPRQFAQAVKALNMEHGGFGESGANGMVLFKAIYKGLEQGNPKAIDFAKRMNLGEQAMFMEASPLASEVMKRMGIPGIKYLDAGSRGQGGSGTRNFVVFPGEEKKVRILERDGQKAPPQKIAQALESAPRKPEMAFDAPEVKPGDIVDGLKVRPEVANVESIKASLDNYTVLPGIRSVSIADFGEAGPLTGNVDKLDRRTRNLADQITESKEITPLIVVYSGSQNYILEGSHRIDALDALGKKRIPVIAVIDEDDPPKFMRQKR